MMTALVVVFGAPAALFLGVALWLFIDLGLAYRRGEWDRVSVRLLQGATYGLIGIVCLAVLGLVLLVWHWAG